jgi:AAA domain
MSGKELSEASSVDNVNQNEYRKCFVGYSEKAAWSVDVVDVCNSVLPQLHLLPLYMSTSIDPTIPRRDKAIELVGKANYGLYDLSYWYNEITGTWVMPDNVLIELGIAIVLNRPMLLLRNAKNRISGFKLPTSLESLTGRILEFTGGPKLRQILKEHLSSLIQTSHGTGWQGRYCLMGGRICEYREIHPRNKYWEQKKLHCLISDGDDAGSYDFREIVEEVLERYKDVSYEYLDALTVTSGYDLLLCTQCQRVRSTPFAIYRITLQTSPETFIAIGMSLALEKRFAYNIPKLLLVENEQDVPSLLSGYDVIVARSDHDRKMALQRFIPTVMQMARETRWKVRPLPYIENIKRESEKSLLKPEPTSIFLFNMPLSEPGKFFGRARERTTLLDRIRHGVSISIVGPRGIGKTWLMSFLRLVAAIELGPQFRIAYIDASSPGCTTPEGLISIALEQLRIPASSTPISFLQTPKEDETLKEDDLLHRLMQAANELRSQKQSPVLFIDEFDAIGSNENFDNEFFSGLRAISTLDGLAIVTSTRGPLIEITSSKSQLMTSPFFNIFEQLALRPFAPQEAEEFVRATSVDAGFTEEERRQLLRISEVSQQGWPPQRLQLAGTLLLKDRTLKAQGSSDAYRPDDSTYWKELEERLKELDEN